MTDPHIKRETYNFTMNEQDLDFNPNIKTKHRLIEDEPDELGRRKWKL